MKIFKYKKNTINPLKQKNPFSTLFQKTLIKNFSSPNTSIVKINYKDLINNHNENTQKQIFEAISSAYNKDGLGLMVVEKVPKILQIKKNLWKLITN